ncbi:MAG: hypothetical protein NC311_18145, partial [Muribaculaceae bacterium]|nr:hypothetical protein [Muribaculaceae bacterium]
LRITYLDGDGKEVCLDAPESVWQDGYWDVIMPYPEDCPDQEITIVIDHDGENGDGDGDAVTDYPAGGSGADDAEPGSGANNADDETAAAEKMNDGGDVTEAAEKADGGDGAQAQGPDGTADDAGADEENIVIEEKIVYLPAVYQIDLSGIRTAEPEELPSELLAEELPSEAGTVLDMTAPVIKKITARDTTAVLKFVPNDVVRSVTKTSGADGGTGFYTLALTDKVTGKMVEAVNTADVPAETKAAAACTYTLSIGADSTEAAPLYTCEIRGLSSNKSYIAAIVAHYEKQGATPLEKSSKNMNFTTKKVMLTSGGSGSLPVSYVTMADLRANPNAVGTVVKYGETEVTNLGCGVPYALFAEVNNLSRALETEKLKWTIQIVNDDGTKKTADKKSATLKAGTSTYEARLELLAAGRYEIVAASAVTKEPLASFIVVASQSGGGGGSQLSLQSELFYFYQEPREEWQSWTA